MFVVVTMLLLVIVLNSVTIDAAGQAAVAVTVTVKGV